MEDVETLIQKSEDYIKKKLVSMYIAYLIKSDPVFVLELWQDIDPCRKSSIKYTKTTIKDKIEICCALTTTNNSETKTYYDVGQYSEKEDSVLYSEVLGFCVLKLLTDQHTLEEIDKMMMILFDKTKKRPKLANLIPSTTKSSHKKRKIDDAFDYDELMKDE